jgi:hypothetical protein
MLAYSSMANTHLHMPTSPMVGPNTAFGLDHSMAKAIMSSCASAFAKRSQSFIHRGGRAGATRYPVPSMDRGSEPHLSGKPEIQNHGLEKRGHEWSF